MKIDLAEMQRILTRSQDINQSLESEFAEMTSTLDEICANVSSSELTESNKKLTNGILEISNKVQTNLPAIIEFLRTQISSYQATNESTKSQLDSLISAVDGMPE